METQELKMEDTQLEMHLEMHLEPHVKMHLEPSLKTKTQKRLQKKSKQILLEYIKNTYSISPEQIVELLKLYKSIIDKYGYHNRKDLKNLRNYQATLVDFGNIVIWIVPEISLYAHDINDTDNNNYYFVKYIIETSEIIESLMLPYNLFYSGIIHTMLFINITPGKKTENYIYNSLQLRYDFDANKYSCDENDYENDYINYHNVSTIPYDRIVEREYSL